jgi:hypothetical protein
MTPSFIKDTKTKREVILGLLHGRITGKFSQGLKNFDDFVSYCETLANLGTQVSISGISGKIQITNEDLKEHLGDELFAELSKIATDGRAFLNSVGYESKAKVAPSMLLGTDSTSASGFLEPFKVENPGEPPLSGVKITTFDQPKA